MAVLKEDCQPFGVIICKLISKKDGFAHPIISAPLATATPEAERRQSDKCSLRNFSMREANAVYIKHVRPKDITYG